MMMKLSILVLKSLCRNRLRTAVTALGIVVLVAISSVVTTVTTTVRRKMLSSADESRLIVTERWLAPSRVPLRYVPDIAGLEGVRDWTTMNTVFGYLDESRRLDRTVLAIATRPDNIRTMYGGLHALPSEAVEALLQRKDGVLAGPALVQTMGWQVGREFTFHSAGFPPVDVPFTIVGILPPGDWSNAVFCRHDYYMDATGDRSAVNCVLLDAGNPAAAHRLAARVNSDYENRQPALKVETESAGVSRFANKVSALLQILDGIAVVLLIDMVIILSNSIGISVRERRAEMAMLKVLGFQPLHIIVLIVAEAMVVGGVAGALGTAVVWAVSSLTVGDVIPVMLWNRLFLQFPIPWTTVLLGIAVGVGVGITGSLLPATAARRVRVSDVFAKIA
ncbi:MAG: ABC transporter permease [Planctomycetaceae bacterium]|nr:ABC transporter permease [Planctomycetaceae bacterium]